ncbi:MAG TPA: TetR/AcrR family transcriptional regulator [Gemmatimonadales bacterium]|nr:TetR/AcrR family transcriptional regulator [Gemmatimonadales bacterium]
MTPVSESHRYPIDDRARRILAAAFGEFSRRGFSAARLGTIARKAGVAPATMQLYFPSKHELFREVVRSTIVTSLPGPAHPPDPDTPAAPASERVRDFIRDFWRTMDDPEQSAMLRLAIAELPDFPELAVFHTTEVIGRSVSRLERILTDGSVRGEFRIHDARTAARIIHSALITYSLWFASPGIYGALTGMDRKQAEDAVMDVLSGALGACR